MVNFMIKLEKLLVELCPNGVEYKKLGDIAQLEKALVQIITEEKLKESETRAFVAGTFHDGGIKPTGTDIDKILPAVSCFGGGGRNRKAKKPTSKISRNSLNDFET